MRRYLATPAEHHAEFKAFLDLNQRVTTLREPPKPIARLNPDVLSISAALAGFGLSPAEIAAVLRRKGLL